MGKPHVSAAVYPPAHPIGGADLGPPPTGATCDYYGEANAFIDAGFMRLCYFDDKLVQKASYYVEGEGAQVCVWEIASTSADCH